MKRLVCCLFLGWTLVAGRAQPGAFALTGVTLVDAAHERPVARHTVVISGGIIADVFPDGSKPLADSVVVMRLNGRFLVPGLIDTHVHMATDPSGVDNRASTLAVLERMLHSGITSVRDMAGDGRILAGLSRDALTGDIVSPDIYFSALMAGPVFFKDPRTIASTRGGVAGGMPYMRAVTDTTDMQQAMAEAFGTGARGIKLYANLDGKLVEKIVAAAHRQGLLVWGHAWLQIAKPSDLVKAEVGSISHAPLLIREVKDSVPSSWKKPGLPDRFWRDSVPDLSALFTLMKQHHTILDATMLTYRQWAEQDSNMRYNYAITKALTAAAYRAGVTICAGTDDDQVEFVQKEMELLVHDAGMSPRDALIAATLHGAQALRIDGVCGTLEKGKRADLLVVEKDPMEKIENIRTVALVIKKGQIVR